MVFSVVCNGLEVDWDFFFSINSGLVFGEWRFIGGIN